MTAKTLKVSDLVASKTNPRGSDGFAGQAFDDLVASVKEKGVIVPILVRPAGKKFEVVAGNRRLAAAKKAGIEEIPAQVGDLTDSEAREAQIIENLHRADVHPIEEGLAYRELIESAKPKMEVHDVAAKVGKSEKYVRNRMILTNLTDALQKKLRAGSLPLVNAVEFARLSHEGQTQVMKYLERSVYNSVACDLKMLRKHIAEQTFNELRKSPPWENDEAMKVEISRVLGVDIDKETASTLFGEKAMDRIENPADYARAMSAYIELTKRKYAADGKPLTLVSDNYSTRIAGVKGRGEYETDRVKGCKSLHDGLIVEGDGIGKIIKICTNKACKPHHPYQYERADNPKDEAKRKAQRKAQIAAEKKKKEREAKLMAKAVAKMASPMPPKQIETLLGLAIKRAHYDTLRVVAKRRELEGKRYDQAVRAAAKEMSAKEKAGLLLEVMIPSWNIAPDISKIFRSL